MLETFFALEEALWAIEGARSIVGDAVVYEADPETLARHVRAYADRGARIVGGCCGSTPERIAAIARALGLRPPRPAPP